METDILINIGGRKKISPETILMLKADINYTYVHLACGNILLTSTTIGIIEKRLKDFNFFRPNRSTIINLEYLDNFEAKEETGNVPRIIVKNSAFNQAMNIKVSRRKVNDIIKIIKTHSAL